MRIKICRKEAKETKYWLSLVKVSDADTDKRLQSAIQEASELTRIFGAILEKTK